jgi:hypothetical protein
MGDAERSSPENLLVLAKGHLGFPPYSSVSLLFVQGRLTLTLLYRQMLFQDLTSRSSKCI